MQYYEDGVDDHRLRLESERTLGQLTELIEQTRLLHDLVNNNDFGEAQVRGKLQSNFGFHHPISGRLAPAAEYSSKTILDELSIKLKEIDSKISNGYQKNDATLISSPSEHDFCLGSVDQQVQTIPILRGTVEVQRSLPVGGGISTKLALFLISISNVRRTLDRDSGQWGYHYHYCKLNGERSDLVLCFAENLANRPTRTLYWERHSEKNARFRAKPNMWQDRKRVSIYDACSANAGSKPLSEFRKPKMTACPVWPG